jgi:predicted nucleotidyltransferase
MGMVEAALVHEVLERHPRLRLAVVFGSVASGKARPDSDLDLAVAADTALVAAEKTALISDLALRLGRSIDLIDLARVGEPLLGQILIHGKRILGSEEVIAELLRRHLFDMADFVPYRNRILAERRQAWIG